MQANTLSLSVPMPFERKQPVATRFSPVFDNSLAEDFERTARLLARWLKAPVVLIGLLEDKQLTIKTQVGLSEDKALWRESWLSRALCQYVVLTEEPLQVSDIRLVARKCPNLTTPESAITAYSGVPLKTADGILLGTLCVIDSQPRQWQHDELETLHDVAASLVAELELRQKLVDMEQQNADLDAYAHTVSHDLKAPLQTLVGYASLLSEYSSLSAAEMQAYIGALQQGGQKMASMIDDLLLFAKIQQQEMPFEALDMAAIVDAVKKRLAIAIAQSHAIICLPNIWPVASGYGPWVEEIWVNYLSNALKYGGRPPLVELGATVQADGLIRFWLRDNGPGLTVEQQHALFQPFKRLQNEAATVEGHGLGLVIVQRIVNKMGGQVGLESAPGKGSIFSFTLPASPVQALSATSTG